MTPILPRVWALAPSGWLDPGPVVAAGRAGGLGLLDLAPGFDVGEVLHAMRRTAREGGRPFGIRLSADEVDPRLWEGGPEALGLLVCTEPADGDWSGLRVLARRSGRAVAAEVTSRGSARAAAGAGATALVAAGHEAGGRVADETSSLLTRAVLAVGGPPVWVRGGIGPRSAAACRAAGAAGVVLEGAILLARESPLPEAARERIRRWEGGETVVVRSPAGVAHRVFARPDAPALARLRAEADGLDAWEVAWRREVGWGADQAWPIGQDAALAASLARRCGTVGGIVREVERALAGPDAAEGTGAEAESEAAELRPGLDRPGSGPDPAANADGDASHAIEAFQETMRAFLEVQRSTMLRYLAGQGPGPGPALARICQPAPSILAVSAGDAAGGRDGAGEPAPAAFVHEGGGPGRGTEDAELPARGGAEGGRSEGGAPAEAGGEETPDPDPPPQAERGGRSGREVVEAPLIPRSARLAEGGVVLVTDDGRGIARDVAADLRAMGHPVVRARHGVSSGGVEGVNFTSEASVAALLERVRERGPLAGIVHALPLREPSPAQSEGVGPEVRGLALLARGAAGDLGRAAGAGGACLIAATPSGGAADPAGGPDPGREGIAGVLRSLADAREGVRVRVVGLDPADDVEVMAADLVQEIWADDRHVEVGYRAGRRVAPRDEAGR